MGIYFFIGQVLLFLGHLCQFLIFKVKILHRSVCEIYRVYIWRGHINWY